MHAHIYSDIHLNAQLQTPSSIALWLSSCLTLWILTRCLSILFWFKRLWISWFPRLRFCGRWNLRFTILFMKWNWAEVIVPFDTVSTYSTGFLSHWSTQLFIQVFLRAFWSSDALNPGSSSSSSSSLILDQFVMEKKCWDERWAERR